MIISFPLLWKAEGAKKLHSSVSTDWTPVAFPPQIVGYSEVDSRNNNWRPSSKKGNLDVGSNWTLFKSTFSVPTEPVKLRRKRSGVWYGYDGMIMVNNDEHVTYSDFQSMITGSSSTAELNAMGASAISRVIPTNPIADLPQGVAEILREGIPRIPGWDVVQRRKVDPSILADNYLNYAFGISPLMRDMIAFQRASERAEVLINQYAENANRKLRRRYDFSPVVTTSIGVVPNPTTNGRTHMAGPGTTTGIQDWFSSTRGGHPGVRTDITTLTRKTWFKGAFVYHLPKAGKDFSSKLSREIVEMKHLYGSFSPETLYNLTPYSWAADWFSNAGDVVHNISMFAQDGLVMPHGYIMQSNECINSRSLRGAIVGKSTGFGTDSTTDIGQVPTVMDTTITAAYKRRRKATPYGFGLDLGVSLTPRQWAIIAALGLSSS